MTGGETQLSKILLRELEVGRELESARRYEEAEAVLSHAIDGYPTLLIGEYANAIASSARYEYGKMKDRLDESGMGAWNVLAALHNQRGVVYRMMRRYDDALQDFELALQAADDADEKALAHVNKADIFRVGYNKLEQAEHEIDGATSLASFGSFARAKAFNQLGLVRQAQKRSDDAIGEYEKSRDILRALLDSEPDNRDYRVQFGRTINNLGSAFEDVGRIEDALIIQNEALGIFEKVGDQQGIFNAVIGLGRLVTKHGLHEGALEYYKRAEGTLAGKKDYGRVTTALDMHFADAYLALGRKDDAKSYVERFVAGMRAGHLEEQDRVVFRELFGRVAAAYDSAGMNVDGFEEVRKMFD